jgi:hypothetical protein
MANFLDYGRKWVMVKRGNWKKQVTIRHARPKSSIAVAEVLQDRLVFVLCHRDCIGLGGVQVPR